MPVFADSTHQAGAIPSRNIVDRTEGNSILHIAGGPLLCRQIIIVCGTEDSNIGERKSAALLRSFDHV